MPKSLCNGKRATARSLALLISLSTTIALAAVTWTPAPDPILLPPGITIIGATDIDGNPPAPGSILYVEPRKDYPVLAVAQDADTRTDDDVEAPSTTILPDGTAVEWDVTHGSLASERTLGGVPNTWTTPELPPRADIFEAAAANDEIDATVYAKPDDDSTTNPGDPIAIGEAGNRNDAPGIQVAQAAKVVRKWKFFKETPMQWVFVTPQSNSKVNPGQIITMGVLVKDTDGAEANGVPHLTFPQIETTFCGGKYRIKVKLTNAAFDGGGTEKIFDMFKRPPDMIEANFKFTIDPMWTGADPVTVRLTVMDEMLVLNTFKLQDTARPEDVRDPDLILPLPGGVITFTKITQCCTTIVAAEGVQHHEPPGDTTVYSEQEKDVTKIKYLCGPDLNGANPAPNYGGVTINEKIGLPTSNNVDYNWILLQIRNNHPGDTVDEIIQEELAPLNVTATFTIGPDDCITDRYQMTIAKNVFTQLCWIVGNTPPSPPIASKNVIISVTRGQEYSCGGGAIIGTRTLLDKAKWDIVAGAVKFTHWQKISDP